MSIEMHIKKRLGSFQLDVDLFMDKEIMGILGASGCGKSMTLQCIAGIVTPDEGRIVLNGKVLYDAEKKINLPPQKRRVGYLFQNYALFPNMSVWENIMTGLRREKDKGMKEQTVRQIMGILKLSGLEQHKPSQLSGGQQQRVALARILVTKPEILLMDEPFSALDSFLKEQVQVELMRLLKEYNKDVILVTHSRDEAYRLCKKLTLMDQGKILKTGDLKQLFCNPETAQGAILTGCKNIAVAQVKTEHEMEIPEWGIRKRMEQFLPKTVCAVGIRAHDIKIVKNLEQADAKAIVDQVVECPFDWLYCLRIYTAMGTLSEKQLQYIAPKNLHLCYEEGQELLLCLPENHLMLFDT